MADNEGTARHGMPLDAVEAYLTGDEWTFTKGALDDELDGTTWPRSSAGRTGRRSTPRRPQRAVSDGLPPIPRQPALPRRPLHPRRRGGPHPPADAEAAEAEVTRGRQLIRELANAALLLDAAAEMLARPRRPADGDPQQHGHAPNVDAVRQLLHRLFSAACYQSADAPDPLTDLRSSLRGVPAGVPGALPLPRLRDGGAAFPSHIIRRGHSADRTTPARRFASVFVAIKYQDESRAAADDWFADQRALAQTRHCPTLDLSALRQNRPASGGKRGAAPPAVRYSAAAAEPPGTNARAVRPRL
ncbi:MAG: hypothetical protein WBP81_01815 [Solirubrobacteraceae bacterium]